MSVMPSSVMGRHGRHQPLAVGHTIAHAMFRFILAECGHDGMAVQCLGPTLAPKHLAKLADALAHTKNYLGTAFCNHANSMSLFRRR